MDKIRKTCGRNGCEGVKDCFESKKTLNNLFDNLTVLGKSVFSIELVVYFRIWISKVQR